MQVVSYGVASAVLAPVRGSRKYENNRLQHERVR
jgi:hypothetical protein